MRQDLANRILTAATTRLGELVTLNRGASIMNFTEFFRDVLRCRRGHWSAVTTDVPTLILNAEDLPIEPAGNDRVTVANGSQYLVRETRQDGEGGLVLLMYQHQTNNYL